jgi:sulfur carrier protein
MQIILTKGISSDLSSLSFSALSSSKMKITVNNKDHSILPGANLSALLGLLDISSGQGLAIAINNCVIPRSRWQTYELREGDTILLVKASQGG